MERFCFWCSAAVVAVVCLCTSVACEDLFENGRGGEGFIVVNFGSGEFSEGTKARLALPDSNDFILKVSNPEGAVLYEGRYGAAPKEIAAGAGSYHVEVWSREFTEPLFETPQFGDAQTVIVEKNQKTRVVLNCSQLNSGLRLIVEKSFANVCPEGNLFACSPDGRLLFGYSETRTAFFRPGQVRITLSREGREETLMSRTLQARQILTVRLTAGSSSGKGGFGIQIDTSRNWTSESYNLGSVEEGSSIQTAYSVLKAKQHIGEENVWVYGYIVGGDLSSSKCSFDSPFTSRTNIVIAEKSSCRDKKDCLSVQLSQGDIRDALNLVDNSPNLGLQVFLKGKIVSSYYGIPGIQSVSEYRWK